MNVNTEVTYQADNTDIDVNTCTLSMVSLSMLPWYISNQVTTVVSRLLTFRCRRLELIYILISGRQHENRLIALWTSFTGEDTLVWQSSTFSIFVELEAVLWVQLCKAQTAKGPRKDQYGSPYCTGCIRVVNLEKPIKGDYSHATEIFTVFSRIYPVGYIVFLHEKWTSWGYTKVQMSVTR